MDQRLADRWAETGRLLRAVLAEVRARIDPEQSFRVLEYLEQNELGLAYETLIEAIRDGQLALGADATTGLDAACTLMQLKE